MTAFFTIGLVVFFELFEIRFVRRIYRDVDLWFADHHPLHHVFDPISLGMEAFGVFKPGSF